MFTLTCYGEESENTAAGDSKQGQGGGGGEGWEGEGEGGKGLRNIELN